MSRTLKPWFKHDIDAQTDLKLIALRQRLGWEGVGLYWAVVERIYSGGGKQLLSKDYQMLAFAEQLFIKNEQLKNLLNVLCDLDLVSFSDGVLTSERVQREIEENERIREVRANASKCRASASKISNRIDKNRIDKKEKEKKEKADAGASEPTEQPEVPNDDEPKLHPSPKAPKSLNRKPEELERFPGSEDGHVWLTRSEYLKLCEEIGQLETDVLISRLEIYSSQNPPRFKRYIDHYKTLRAFRRKYLEDGKVFFTHPQSGPGYYFPRDIEQFRGEA